MIKAIPFFLVATAYSSSPPHQLCYSSVCEMHPNHFTYIKKKPNQVKNRAIQTYDNMISRKTVTLVIQMIKSNTTLLEFD